MSRESLNHLSFGIETAHSEISITVRQADLPAAANQQDGNRLHLNWQVWRKL
jgi:hypothetical protein